MKFACGGPPAAAGDLTKTPALVGVGMRTFLMHDGCADSIEERLRGDPRCTGGDAHVNLDHLSDAELDDLAAYLRAF